MCPQLCDAQDDVCGADCGAAAAVQKSFIFSFTLILSLIFVLCDVGHLSSLRLTPLTYLADLLSVFLLAFALLSFLSSAVIV